MSKKLFLVSLLVFFGLGIGTLSAGPPKPKAQKIPVIVDIAVVDISSTGPTGTPHNAPIITIQNKGTKTINQHLGLLVKQNGQPVYGDGKYISLIPGQKFVWNPRPADAGFAKPGDTIEATIDHDNQLKEDNEENNMLSKQIPFPLKPPIKKK